MIDTIESLDRSIELLRRRAEEMDRRAASYRTAIEYLEEEKRDLEIDPTSMAARR